MKGQKTGGRTKGTPNKTTKTVRTALVDFLQNYAIEDLQNDFDKLEPKDRILLFEKLTAYIIPKATDPTEIENACYNRADIRQSEFGESGKGKVNSWIDEQGSALYKAEREAERSKKDIERSLTPGWCFYDCSECTARETCDHRKEQNKLSARPDCWDNNYDGCEVCELKTACELYRQNGDFCADD